MAESLAGQLLLAAPNLADPNFARSVVLIGVHSGDGAMGLVLNRPSELTIADAVPELDGAVAGGEPLYLGGPVQRSAIVCLAEFLDPTPAGLLVLGRIGFPARDVDQDALSFALRGLPAGARVSSRPRLTTATGSRKRRSPRTSSPRSRPGCGAACWRAREGASRCSRACRSIRA